MIIDFHTHIFPKIIRDHREDYFEGEPAFKWLYQSAASKMAGPGDLIQCMDRDGVDKAVVFGFPWQNPDLVKLHNDEIIAAVDAYPDRLIGFGCMDPLMPGADAEVARCAASGLKGVGELALYSSALDEGVLDRLEPLMAVCREKDLPVLIHTNESIGHAYPGKAPITIDQTYGLAARFGANRIILAHWGGGLFFFNLLKKAVKATLSNVWFDTAASPYLYDPDIYAAAVKIIGSQKILFGSDYPLLPPKRYFKDISASGIGSTDVDAICGGSAAAVLKMTGA